MGYTDGSGSGSTSTIQVNTSQLWSYGENLGYAGIKYNQAAVNQHAALARARECGNIIGFSAALTKNATGDITSEAFSSVLRMNEEIARLKAERESAMAALTTATVAPPEGDSYTPAQHDQLVTSARNDVAADYDPLIADLETQKEAVVTLINGDLATYTSKLEAMLGKIPTIFAAFDSLNSYDMGHAYINLRLTHAGNTIDQYCDSVETNEEQAMRDFLHTFPTVEVEGQTPDPEIGGGWREIEVTLVGLAQSGYVTPTIESGINEPFVNSAGPVADATGYPPTYEIASAYHDAGLYNSTSDAIQEWYDYYRSQYPGTNYNHFVEHMTELYDAEFPDSGSADEAQELTDAINRYIAVDPSRRTVYSYFYYWWIP